MDYAYYGPATDLSLTSTVASLAGVLLIFSRQLVMTATFLSGLAIDDLRRFLAQVARPWLATLGLLAVPLILPRSGLVMTMRGLSRIEAEIDLARTDGYYEELIQTSPDRRKARPVPQPPGRKSFADSGLMDEVPDYRRRVLRPGLNARWNETTFRTNSLGYRGPEISRRKPPGTFRVVVLGSSNTLGHGVNEEDSYVRLLEAWLTGRAGPGHRVEVVNLAVSGDSPTQQLIRLRTETPGLDPDWILSDITALDFSLEEQHLRWVVGKKVKIPFAFVREALAGSHVEGDDSQDEFHRKIRPFLKPMLDRIFEERAAESRRIGAPLTILILPRADSKTESPGLFQLFRDLSDRHGLRSIDLSHVFDRLPLDEYRAAPWDHHPNALGHRLLFARLRDELLGDEAFVARLNGSGGGGERP